MPTLLTVAIDAQVPPDGSWGGVEQFVRRLVGGLRELTDGDERYLIVVSPDNVHCLDELLGPNQRATPGPKPRTRFEGLKVALGPLRGPALGLWRAVRRSVEVPPRTAFYRDLGATVLHIPYQGFVRSGLPTIYNPHDLQHRHLPRFFTREQIAWREAVYATGCREAAVVVTPSRWSRDDVIRQYGTPADRIHVIYHGSPAGRAADIGSRIMADVRARFSLPDAFALYPAQTWPHKNHLRLLAALRTLRDRSGVRLHLVCTGVQNEFWPTIEALIRTEALADQVRFLGYVPEATLRVLYRLASFVVLPSLFEGGGLPVLEAFQEGAPVACSNVTSLPEYAGEAARLFDPDSVDSIAAALHDLATDAPLRRRLRDAGRERARRFTWERTARAYRALYRKVAGKPLSEEDRELLAG